MRKVHFIAIGGSAMHNLAIALHRKGYEVTGSDDEIFDPSKTRLKNEGILPEQIGWHPEILDDSYEAVILGMHARIDNPELIRAQELGLKVYSYPEYLYEQSKDKTRIVIGGSHGKTTITSMILHVMKYAGVETDFMVGAQLEGFDVMVRLSETAKYMVIEGDEYLTSPIDRVPKFHKYHPHIAVISGIGWDHVNVFPTFDSYLEQFRIYVDTIEEGGCLIYDVNDVEAKKIAATSKAPAFVYDIHEYHTDGESTYLISGDKKIKMQIFGEHNMKNINAARNVCNKIGISDEIFYEAIASFKGASRRLELMSENKEKNSLIFRDFAHAPSKVLATAKALREQYRDKYLVIVFELHTYSSLSEVFINHYEHCLADCEKAVVFYDPHAVAIKKLEMMSDERIVEGFARKDIKVVHSKGELLEMFNDVPKENVVIGLMSSGDFNGLTKDDLVEIF
ncbi:MAG: peptidoglycan synthetase [Bacteroidales bacterium]|nr:peptidoglycan synthetase [Bacteroidales bacterium]MBQ8223022.1 peptidoglycan synthetase [Bacteroidales bacterium]